MKRYLAYLFLFLALAVFQVSFLDNLPYLNHVNLVLTVFVFVSLLEPLRFNLFNLIWSGVLLDIFSYLPFGSYIISFFLAWLAVWFLQVKVFSDFALLSALILTAVGTIVLDLSTYILSKLALIANFSQFSIIYDGGHLIDLSLEIAANLILVTFIFLVAVRVSKRLNLSVISTKK